MPVEKARKVTWGQCFLAALTGSAAKQDDPQALVTAARAIADEAMTQLEKSEAQREPLGNRPAPHRPSPNEIGTVPFHPKG